MGRPTNQTLEAPPQASPQLHTAFQFFHSCSKSFCSKNSRPWPGHLWRCSEPRHPLRAGAELSGHKLYTNKSVGPPLACDHISLAWITIQIRFYCHLQSSFPNLPFLLLSAPVNLSLNILLFLEEKKTFLCGLQVCPHPFLICSSLIMLSNFYVPICHSYIIFGLVTAQIFWSVLYLNYFLITEF